jgi:hypothetical protein
MLPRCPGPFTMSPLERQGVGLRYVRCVGHRTARERPNVALGRSAHVKSSAGTLKSALSGPKIFRARSIMLQSLNVETVET